MNKLVYLLFACLLISCSNNNDNEIEIATDPINIPPENTSKTFVYENSYEIENLNLDGNRNIDKNDLLLDLWSLYENPFFDEIILKKDSILFNEDKKLKYSYKYEVKNDDLFVEINDEDIFIGKVIDENEELIIYKKYLSYLVVLDKENYTFTTERSSDLGFYEEKDIYPRIVNSPADLKEDEEFILWSTISYRFMLKTNSPE